MRTLCARSGNYSQTRKSPRLRTACLHHLQIQGRWLCIRLNIHDWQHKHVRLGMQAQAASLRRITQGGLDEASILYAEGLAGNSGEAGRRSAVA